MRYRQPVAGPKHGLEQTISLVIQDRLSFLDDVVACGGGKSDQKLGLFERRYLAFTQMPAVFRGIPPCSRHGLIEGLGGSDPCFVRISPGFAFSSPEYRQKLVSTDAQLARVDLTARERRRLERNRDELPDRYHLVTSPDDTYRR